MAVDQRLLDILVCPECHEQLLYFEEDGFLLCAGDRLRFAVTDDVPDMLVDEAERLSSAEVDALVARSGEADS